MHATWVENVQSLLDLFLRLRRARFPPPTFLCSNVLEQTLCEGIFGVAVERTFVTPLSVIKPTADSGPCKTH